MTRSPSQPHAGVVAAVLARCIRDIHWCCEICGDPLSGERGVDWALHHRRGRSRRIDTHEAQNLLIVHGVSNVDGCHGRIHGNRGEAEMYGWSISRNGPADPLDVAVLVDGGSRWVYLTASDTYSDEPPRLRAGGAV